MENLKKAQRKDFKKTQIFKENKPITYLNTFNTRIVAGELTTDSFLFLAASTSGGSSRGFDDADVASF